MASDILRSRSDWFVVLLVGVVGFVLFSAGQAAIALLGDGEAPGKLSMAIRFLLSFVIAASMLTIQRRRERPSLDAATIDGIQVAAVVIISTNLGGVSEGGSVLALRTTLILLGLPFLTVLTHVVTQRLSPKAS